MSEYQSAIRDLRAETLHGPVFGHEIAFGQLTPERTALVDRQIATVASRLAGTLHEHLTTALTDYPPEMAHKYVKAIVPKTAAFVPTLTVGELATPQGTDAITAASLAIGGMYATDQLIDMGDRPMLLAVENTFGSGAVIPSEHIAAVQNRNHILDLIKTAVFDISAEDGPAVFDCFDQKVLVTEAWLQRMSHTFKQLDAAGRSQFLDAHSRPLAMAMTRNAGVQSVAGSLHASYRQSHPELPPLADIHAHPAIKRMLRVSSTVARVADEYSDWWMDAGNDPRYGEFSINPFNHYHPALIDQLSENADITDAATRRGLHEAFRTFHDSDENRRLCGEFITNTFFAQMRSLVPATLDFTPNNYQKYITLVMRVGEISHVNMRGDIALSG